MANDLISGLKDKGRRLTRPRKAILDMLERSKSPMSASEIHASLKQAGVPADLVTVYRTVTVLKDLGLISLIELQEGQCRYEVRQGREHRHHIRCRGCGRIVDLILCPLKKLTALVERETRFLVEDHALEFFGWCPKCR